MIAAVADFIGSPAFASSGTDVQVLRTASAIEVLAVSTYKTALGLPYIGGSDANAFLKQFAKTTMLQHSDHLDAFQAATTALGGSKQDKPDPATAAVVDAAVKSIGKASAAKGTQLVLALALELENIAAQTYVNNMSLLANASAKKVTASVMGIEAQHVAILNAAVALLKAGDVDPVLQPKINAAYSEVTSVTELTLLVLMVETVAGETYQNALAAIKSAAAIKTAAAIEPVEFQHVAILNYLLGDYPVTAAFTSTTSARLVKDYRT